MLNLSLGLEDIYALGAVIAAVLISVGILAGTVKTEEGGPLVVALVGTGISIRAIARQKKHRRSGRSRNLRA